MHLKIDPRIENTSMEDISDHDLVLQIQAGKRFALNTLMGRYKEKLYRFVWRNLHNEEMARDIVQETFVKAYFNIQKYDPHYRFSTWIYQIALNLCRDYHRRPFFSKHHVSISTIDEDDGEQIQLASHTPDVSEALSSKQELAKVQKAIQSLPRKLREALTLYVFEEKSQQECADILGVSPKTVETRVYRARQLLGIREQKNEG